MADALADVVLPYLGRALLATAHALLVLLGPGLAIGAVMHALAGAIARHAEREFGFRRYYLASGWLGTAVHEAGHALFALLFGHRVTAVKWFDIRARDGYLGQVHHRYDPRSPYQQVGRFFIGVGPLILGTAVVYAAARGLLGAAVFAPAASIALVGDGALAARELPGLAADVARAVRDLVTALVAPERLATWRFWAFVYVAFTVGSSIQLSRPDLEGAVRGLGAVAALLLVAHLATLWAGDLAATATLAAARACASAYAVMLLVVAAHLVAAAIVFALPLALRAARALAGRR